MKTSKFVHFRLTAMNPFISSFALSSSPSSSSSSSSELMTVFDFFLVGVLRDDDAPDWGRPPADSSPRPPSESEPPPPPSPPSTSSPDPRDLPDSSSLPEATPASMSRRSDMMRAFKRLLQSLFGFFPPYFSI
jgi:hypothetical protein